MREPNGKVLQLRGTVTVTRGTPLPYDVPECVSCRMANATRDQAIAVAHDLAHVVRTLDPTHPVLDSLGCFVEVGE